MLRLIAVKLLPVLCLSVYGLLGGVLFHLISNNVPHSDEENCKMTFWEAFYFASSIFTTIGNAKKHACSAWGKSAAMGYAVFGIPLCLLSISNLADVLALLGSAAWAKRPIRSKKVAVGDEEESESQQVPLPAPIALFLIISYLLLTTGVFAWLEDWDYFSALHFLACSVTTIGYDNDNKKSKFELAVLYDALILMALAATFLVLKRIQRSIAAALDSFSHRFLPT